MKPFIKIGRDSSNDIVINEPRVSRNHAIITGISDGTYEIRDLGSTNGTFVNGKRVTREIILPGDKVEVAGALVNWYQYISTAGTRLESSPVLEEPLSRIRKSITIGSSNDNDIVIPEEYVSGHHSRISLMVNGDYFIEDTGSTNGTFVNGIRVNAKNFSRTDSIKIAGFDLPADWHKRGNIRHRVFKDHKRTWLTVMALLLLSSAGVLYYFYGCKWLGYGCSISPSEMYYTNRGSIVHIIHSYYYTIDFKGTSYYVGKNRLFKVTEANTSTENLLPYASTEGVGCMVNGTGTILTTFLVGNPWVNEVEKEKMLKEVLASKTIEKFNLSGDYNVCGKTQDLKWLPCGSMTNQQNYTGAVSEVSCQQSDSIFLAITSVKGTLPEGNLAAIVNFDKNRDKPLIDGKVYFYSYLYQPRENTTLRDTFFSAADTFDINKLSRTKLNKNLPQLNDESFVFNDRGELIGIVYQNSVNFLKRKY
ncbi:MAG: FHA domain-containing protein [Bacteroidales bacterium]